eukprot:scaffold2901_cov99-Skeletonema_marinoi.AAC.8
MVMLHIIVPPHQRPGQGQGSALTVRTQLYPPICLNGSPVSRDPRLTLLAFICIYKPPRSTSCLHL